MGQTYDDGPPVTLKSSRTGEAAIVNEVQQWLGTAPFPEGGVPISGNEDAEAVVIQRVMRRKSGSWWQVPKDLKYKD
jgi:hypothetical protein